MFGLISKALGALGRGLKSLLTRFRGRGSDITDIVEDLPSRIKVRINAVLDAVTCDYCSSRNGKILEFLSIEDLEAAFEAIHFTRKRKGLPPYHPSCRCGVEELF